MTIEEAKHITKTSERCTEATLRAFGIEGVVPAKCSGILAKCIENGYEFKELQHLGDKGKALHHALKYLYRDEKYLILTPGHAMAYINGILIDTGNTDPKTIVERIFLIWKS
jgi:hypothetical protein